MYTAIDNNDHGISLYTYVCAVCACFVIYELLYLIFNTTDSCVQAKLIPWELYYHSLSPASESICPNDFCSKR